MADRPLGDYIEVAERIQQFYDAHPQGSLRTIEWKIVQAQGFDKNGDVVQQTFIVYHAEAKRDPSDAGCHGIAWEVFPGRTNFTRGSELMNAETSAWGRALAALGIATKAGIASMEEVRNRQAERELHAYPPNSGKVVCFRKMTEADEAEDDYSQPQDLQLTPEYAPGSIDSKQRNALHREFARLGITDRAVRLKVCEGTLREGGLWTNLNHPAGLSTSNELSWHEADALLKALREMKADES